jgi:two-component system nitrogen regulation response regulator GlnG
VRLQLPPLRGAATTPQLAGNFLLAARKLGASPSASPQQRWSCCAPTTGRATCASWKTCAGGWPHWRRARRSPKPTSRRAAHGAALGAREDTPWETALADWARQRLREGEQGNLHAQARERFDKALLGAALEYTHGRRSEAASLLGVGRNTVTRKLGSGRRRRRHDA